MATHSHNLFKLTSNTQSPKNDNRMWLKVYMKVYMKIHIFELCKKEWISEWSLQLYMELQQLQKESLKKIQAWTGFQPMTSVIPVQCSTNYYAISSTESWSFFEWWFQKISIPTPRRVTEIPRGRGSERGKFPKGRGVHKSFLSRGFEMWSNKHLRTLPIDSGNQTKWNILSVQINVRFFVIYFPLLFQLRTMQKALRSNMFNVKSNKMAD